ncbi:MAG: YbjN domain-containing protein [Actinomycetota bacterium]|nr:YbjN domain-containing protein [Actinomycetota bacterium]
MPLIPVATAAERQRAGELIGSWVEKALADGDWLIAADHDPDLSRWYLRMRGEDRDYIALWLTLRQRSIHQAAYVMPAPEENVEETLAYLLRRNADLVGMRFAIGEEDAIYLVGETPIRGLDLDEIDRIVGSAYTYVERHFAMAMSLGFASLYRRRRRS